MVGYQFMLEKLNGNLDGTADISEANILKRFPTCTHRHEDANAHGDGYVRPDR